MRIKYRLKNGRPEDIPEERLTRLKRIPIQQRGWTAIQVENLDVRKTGNRYHYTSTYQNEKNRSENEKLYLGRCKLTRDKLHVLRNSSFKNIHKLHL